VPADDEIANLEFSGRAVIEASETSPVYQAVAGMLQKIL
jgi:hypothetical protein